MTYWPFFILLVVGSVYGAGVAIKEDTAAFFGCMKTSLFISGAFWGFIAFNQDLDIPTFLFLTVPTAMVLGGIFYIFSLGLRS